MSEPEEITEPYAWLSWLGEKDAHVLLLTLMQAIEGTEYPGLHHHASIEDLRWCVSGWRRNALRALTADNWQAQVDKYLEVRVDARLTTLTKPVEDDIEGSDSPPDVHN
jgi:hypothetical protein